MLVVVVVVLPPYIAFPNLARAPAYVVGPNVGRGGGGGGGGGD